MGEFPSKKVDNMFAMNVSSAFVGLLGTSNMLGFVAYLY